MKIDTLEFYHELEDKLLTSTSEQRGLWASIIVKEGMNLKTLSQLLFSEPKTALRFQWLLSGIGYVDKEKLFEILPYLFELRDEVNRMDYNLAFATYWMIAGVPLENESEAIDMVFEWLYAPKVNITMKSRSLMVLLTLTNKYPDLQHEAKICIEDQLDRHSLTFKIKALKVLNQI